VKHAKHAAPHAATTHAVASPTATAVDYGAEFRMLLATSATSAAPTTPAPDANPFVALLSNARAEADARAEAERQRGRVVMMCNCGDPRCPFPGTDGYGLRPVRID
jgi:hypothetical protein